MNFADLNWEACFRFHQKWLNYTRHMYKSFIALQNEVWRLNNDKWTYAYQMDVKAFKFTRWESTSTIVPFEPLSQESPWRDLVTISCSLPMEIERPVSILVYNHPRQDTQAPIQVLKEFTMISFLPELILRCRLNRERPKSFLPSFDYGQNHLYLISWAPKGDNLEMTVIKILDHDSLRSSMTQCVV